MIWEDCPPIPAEAAQCTKILTRVVRSEGRRGKRVVKEVQMGPLSWKDRALTAEAKLAGIAERNRTRTAESRRKAKERRGPSCRR